MTTRTIGAIIWATFAIAGCDVGNVRPEPEIRTTTVTVQVPTPVPCFSESERPLMPAPTFTSEAQIAAASPEQLAAADRADRLALEVYTAQVDALFIKCKGSTP